MRKNKIPVTGIEPTTIRLDIIRWDTGMRWFFLSSRVKNKTNIGRFSQTNLRETCVGSMDFSVYPPPFSIREKDKSEKSTYTSQRWWRELDSQKKNPYSPRYYLPGILMSNGIISCFSEKFLRIKKILHPYCVIRKSILTDIFRLLAEIMFLSRYSNFNK